jgi:hypothetical protein
VCATLWVVIECRHVLLQAKFNVPGTVVVTSCSHQTPRRDTVGRDPEIQTFNNNIFTPALARLDCHISPTNTVEMYFRL